MTHIPHSRLTSHDARRITILWVILLVAWTSAARAETWEWVDSQGTVSFTDDPQQIPKQYRRSARKIAVDVAPLPAPEKDVPAPAGTPAPSPEAKGGTAAVPEPAAVERAYGGKTAVQWQGAFDSLDGELRKIDHRLKEKQRQLREAGAMTDTEYQAADDEIRKLSARRAELIARFETLRKEATAARVPLEFR